MIFTIIPDIRTCMFREIKSRCSIKGEKEKEKEKVVSP